IEAFRHGDHGELKQLARMAARFAADSFDELKAANPSVPAMLENREADNWRPLLAIAEAAGGAWPSVAREVAEKLVLASRATEQSKSVMLLEDIHALLPGFSGKQVPSAELVKALAQLEDRPWAESKGGKPIPPNAVARLLAPFQIKPFEMRMGAHVVRGYEAAQFADAFARYVEAATVSSATPLQPIDPDCSEASSADLM